MLKTYDQGCMACEWLGEIWTEPYTHPPCPACGGMTERRWRRLGIIRDEIPGGQWIENLGHEPVKVYSQSELKAKAAERGLELRVKHVPVPGTDKSPYTTSWSAAGPSMQLPKHYQDKALLIADPT